MSHPSPTPVYYNIQVVAERITVDGVTSYITTCYPKSITVTTPNAVLGYQLVGPTPASILFTGMRKNNPPPQRQLSDATVSVDGRMLLISDRNSLKVDIDISLLFSDGGEVEFSHDPQIGNVPES